MHRPATNVESHATSPSASWPRVRLLVALVLVVAVTAVPPERQLDWPKSGWAWVAPVVALAALALLAAHRVSLPRLARRLALFLPPWIVLAGVLTLSRGWQLGGPWAVVVFVKGLVSYLVLLALALTTPPAEMLAALGRLGLPRLLVDVPSFVYRYAYVLGEERERMRRARLARGFDESSRGRWRVAVSLVGMLLVRSYERAGRVYAAVRARRFE